MQTTTLPEIITPPEAAKILGCSAKTVIRRIDAGELVPIRTLPGRSGRYLLYRADVESYAARLTP